MLGLMMQTPLLLSSILMHAARSFPDVEIVSRTPDKRDHITSYRGLLQRSSQLAHALNSIGSSQVIAWRR
jgi:3-(methylthio)propionyl---CoA ligase